MAKRKIIRIDENKCNGCGECLPNCPEGAIQVIAGKARLVSDLFCDGLGACLGHCPQAAISIETRETQAYDEEKVMENIAGQGAEVIAAHLKHLREHGEREYMRRALAFLRAKGIALPEAVNGHDHGSRGCPGAKVMDFRRERGETLRQTAARQGSQLRQWPVQMALAPAEAPYFDGADLLIAADCVGFACADFHRDLLKGRILLVACPKLDDLQAHKDKINRIIRQNSLKSVTYARMEVPCCAGLKDIIRQALADCGKTDIPFNEVVIGIKGERL